MDLSIDELALDAEWLEQPGKYLHVAEKLANAQTILDQLKNSLEATEADMHKAVSQDPGAFGMLKAKPTVGDLEAVVTSLDVVKELKEQIVKADHAVRMHKAMVEALKHRKSALENLVTLHVTGYTAEPRKRFDKQESDDSELRVHFRKTAIPGDSKQENENE